MMVKQTRSSKRIIIIDDEKDLRESLKDALSTVCSDICEAENGKTGLQLIKTLKPSLIISDYRMEPLDGLELLKFLHDEKIKTPVIWLTAYATPELYRMAIAYNVYDFFEKPFDLDALKQCVLGALDWGYGYNANRIPNFILKTHYHQLNLAIENRNYELLVQYCMQNGISISSLINALIEEKMRAA